MQKRIATPEEVARLGMKMKWRDIKLPSGEVVTAETIRELFEYAEAGLEAEKQHKPAHAAA